MRRICHGFCLVLLNYNSTKIVHAFHQVKNSWKIERNLHLKRQSNFPVTRIIWKKMRICFFFSFKLNRNWRFNDEIIFAVILCSLKVTHTHCRSIYGICLYAQEYQIKIYVSEENINFYLNQNYFRSIFSTKRLS